MKTPLPPRDPMLQSLVEDANALPRTAAAHVREQNHRRTRRIQRMLLLAVIGTVAGLLAVKSSKSQPETAIVNTVPAEVENAWSVGYIRVYTLTENEDSSASRATSEREKELLADLPGVPLLIVKNDAGQIDRIHVFQR